MTSLAGFMPEATLVVCGVVLAAFFAGCETGAYVLNRLRLRYRAGSGSRRAVLLQRLLDDMPAFVTALLIWTNLSVYLVSAACTAAFERLGADFGVLSRAAAHSPELAATVAAAPVLFVFAELAPKDLYRRRADGLMLSSAGVLWLTVRLVRPVARTLAGLGNAVGRALGLAEERNWAAVSRRALRERFAEGEAQGVFSGPQRLLAQNILQAGSRPAREAARPLDEWPVLSADATAADLLARAAELSSSRVPVCEGDTHRVIGVVHVLKAWGEPSETKLRDLSRPPVWLDGGASVVRALAALRRAQSTMGFLAEGEEGGGRTPPASLETRRHRERREGSGSRGYASTTDESSSVPLCLRGVRSVPAVVTVEGLLRHMMAGER